MISNDDHEHNYYHDNDHRHYYRQNNDYKHDYYKDNDYEHDYDYDNYYVDDNRYDYQDHQDDQTVLFSVLVEPDAVAVGCIAHNHLG